MKIIKNSIEKFEDWTLKISCYHCSSIMEINHNDITYNISHQPIKKLRSWYIFVTTTYMEVFTYKFTCSVCHHINEIKNESIPDELKIGIRADEG